MEKIIGKVKNWESEKGYGYIEVSGEPDVFVHFSGLEGSLRNLVPGSDVKLVVIQGVRGPQAALVEEISE
ncbi:cold-shock protein [Weissella diestrammenae]|uniref:Cold-shock protein n=1 Tax=Weissella diestrammenae TaxID=1162633 RepID=A0A7G9T654_9LACO|nr:cold shock domain-containing protein [Weissella diestrammenae]MCM0582419.1 cold-shock protein [Weissella diestrammenae]QNN75579.1 cold-shock protein [Weissella diestrammenae]